jgi:ABC-type nitrate/sulfonate/bicarbonate transport system substrate-binding protein
VKRKILFPALLLVGLILLSGCDSSNPKNDSVGSTAPLIISTHKGYYSALLWLAKNQGYFPHHGVNVQLQAEESGVASLRRLVAGEADLATVAEFVFVSQHSQNPDLRILASVAEANVLKIIARKDHGISQKSDLRNKRIGFVHGSVADFSLHLYLLFHHITDRDIRLVDLPPSEQVDALTKGNIDAAIVWWPFTEKLETQLGTNAISWPPQTGRDFYWLLVGKDDTIKRRAADMRGVLAALASAEDFMKGHPDEARRIVVSELGSEVKPELWESVKCELSLSRPCLLAMEAQLKWLKARQNSQKFEMPNFLEYIHFDALKSVRPEAIRMPH